MEGRSIFVFFMIFNGILGLTGLASLGAGIALIVNNSTPTSTSHDKEYAPKRNINYFTVKFPENYSKYKSNNIFDTEESSLTVPEIPKLFYSISRKKQREKEDTLNFKKQRTKSCLGFNVDNIFLQKENYNLDHFQYRATHIV